MTSTKPNDQLQHRLTSVDNSRQLSIARNFVLQYYTFLNKAPHLAHRFYSHDSTLIHGTLEKPGEKKAEPCVGLDKIKEKIYDLQLNDCRVKIKQIDSLETLSRGLVIQVIGELSNNGAPMRRFLQTFVLAPGPDESSRQNNTASSNVVTSSVVTQISNTSSTSSSINNDHHHQQQHNHSSQIHASNSTPSQAATAAGSLTGDHSNEKYYVLNNIFRYQDDGLDDDEISSSNINTSVDNPNHISSSTSTTTTTTSIANSSDIVKQHQQQSKHQQLQHKQHNTTLAPSNISTANQHKAHIMTISDSNETTQGQLGPSNRQHQQQSFNHGTNPSSPRQRPESHHHEPQPTVSSRNNTIEVMKESKKQNNDAQEMSVNKHQQASNANSEKLKVTPQTQTTNTQNYVAPGTTTSNQKNHEEGKYSKEHQRLTTHGPSDDKPNLASDSYVNNRPVVSSVAPNNTAKPQDPSNSTKGGAAENKDALSEHNTNAKKDVHTNMNGSVENAEYNNQQNFQLSFASLNEPKTWANMVSKNANPPQQAQAQNQQHQTPGHQTNKQQLNNQTQQFTNQQQTPQQLNTQQQIDKGNRQNRQNRKQELRDGPTPPAPNSNADDRAHDLGSSGDFRNKEKYPDDHQVFVGNLTPDISEDDLRELFKSYGNIQAVRLSKGNVSKSGKPTLDFGFIVFDNPTIVQNILQKKFMMLKNQRLNVEPKRSQAKSQSGYNSFGGRARPNSYASRGSREHKASNQQHQQPQQPQTQQPKITKNAPGT